MKVRVLVAICLMIFGARIAMMAQTGLGDITGLVTDSGGAAIPNAAVTLTNTATGVTINSATNSSGVYIFQHLIPGPYRLEAAAPNFKRMVRDRITLNVDDNLGINLKLEVGGTTETVTVTTVPSALRNQDSQVGEVMTNSVVENFSNLNGEGEVRNVLGALIFAGDTEGAGGSGPSGSGGKAGLTLGINSNVNSYSNLRINGGRTSDTEYLIDGIPITQNMGRQISNTVPTIEDTSEFKVVTNGLGAQYGHLSGGAVDLATQAGTDLLHGSVFDFSQAAALDANTWDNNDTNTPKPGFHQNDFGIAMGGPVWFPRIYNGRRKTFWFANYEGSRYNIGGNAVLSSVLTANERTGDESDMGTAIGDPVTPKPQMYDPYGPSSYPNLVCDGGGVPGNTCVGNATYERYNLLGGDGMHVPSAYLDPIIQQYLKYVPLPNRAPIAGSATGDNYISTPKNVKGTNIYSIRVDENFTDKSRMFVRFTNNNAYNTIAPTFVDTNGNALSTSTDTIVPNAWGLTINYDYSFSPSLLLNLRAGGNYSPYSTGNFLPNGFSNSGWGFDADTLALLGPNNIVPIDGPMTEANNVNAAGQGNSGNLGLYNTGTNLINSTSIVYAASLTKILNRHTLQFGYEGRRYYDNLENSAEQTGGDEFRFTAQVTNQYAEDTWNPQGYANGVGQFLMGLYSWNQSNGAFANALRQNYYAAYAQDDFKASPHLNVSLGLRWETETPVTSALNELTVWDDNAPSPFTIASGWTWGGALAQGQTSTGNPAPLTQQLISEAQEPSWLINGLPKGALEFVNTPQHPSRNANDWHPWNFSPRLGAAWQVRKDTVIRTSGGIFFLPTGGALNGYNSTTGVAYTAQDGNETHTQVQTEGIDLDPRGYNDPLCGCIESPSFPGQVLSKTTDNQTLNLQSAITAQAGAVDTKSHMPLEYDWSLGVQYELKHGFLFEVDYNGNTSHDLLAKDMPGHFPASLFTGGSSGDNATIYKTYVPSPFSTAVAGTQQTLSGENLQSIGELEYGYPYFGELQITNRNIGKSLFNSVNFRVEHRLADGFQLLANYTLSRNMDDVGGAETNQNGPSQGYGQGGKIPQDVDTIRNLYGLSELDEPQRLTVFALYQLPIGRGRHWMNTPSAVGGNALDYLIGGWNVSGDFTTMPGLPLVFTSVNQSGTDQSDLLFHNIYGSYAPGATAYSLKNPHWGGAKSSVYNGLTQLPTAAISAFNATQFVPAQTFVVGTLPPVYSIIRNPNNWIADMTISKNVPILSADGTRYLQIRADDMNFLNHPGIGGYDTNVGDNSFGTIDEYGNQANQERHIQLGARFVF